MKVALIGYGKMGHVIEQIAKQRGHEVVLILDALINPQDFTTENLKKAEVAIEFTRPDAAYQNYLKCFEANIPVVSGTTGWLEKLPEVKKFCQQDKKTFFYSSNFSIGVNIFMQVNKFLAKIMNQYTDYQVTMQEIHHIHKLDKPSGTAISIANDIIKNIERKNNWTLDTTPKPNEIFIDAVRQGEVPGTHTVNYSTPIDDITITHTAHNRTGLALGAVIAAEFLIKQNPGYYTMDDLIKF